MATAAAATHCPECSAPVKTGDKQCWMCFRLLEWEGSVPKAAAASPFAEQPQQQPRVVHRSKPWAIAGIVQAALAMVPSCFVAFFVTCLALSGQGSGDVAIYTGMGAGFVVSVGFCILIGILGTRVTREVRHQ